MIQRIEAVYQVHNRPHLLSHVREVARESADLARRFHADVETCTLAALCHDLAGILRPEDMLSMARVMGFWLDPAEEAYPFLLHQRFGAILARERLGIEDPAILSAIACHSTLRAHATAVDMVVFLADKLAWDQPGTPPYEQMVRQALDRSLPHASLAYLHAAYPTLLHPHARFVAACDQLAQTLSE